jgi:hypothetical protein
MSNVARCLIISLVAAAVLSSPAAWAQGAKKSSVTAADIAKLKPGEFIWAPGIAPAGPMVMVVSLTAQQAYVYRNGVRIGASTVSTGTKGHATPTGVFTILQKKEKHFSNLYNNAPMPFMQRLTWDGIALHAGNLPGYPASHGCVRLPHAFASRLFGETSTGMTVVIAKGAPSPTRLDGGDLLAPVTSSGGSATTAFGGRLAEREPYRWTPELAPSGPVTVLVSSLDQRLVVLRNGKVIGQGRIRLSPGHLVGTHALEFTGVNAQGHTQWIYLDVPGQEGKNGDAFELSRPDELEVSPEYLKLVRGVLRPGATMLATDGSISGGGAGKGMTVIEDDAG